VHPALKQLGYINPDTRGYKAGSMPSGAFDRWLHIQKAAQDVVVHP
jgi:hypothetical protein